MLTLIPVFNLGLFVVLEGSRQTDFQEWWEGWVGGSGSILRGWGVVLMIGGLTVLRGKWIERPKSAIGLPDSPWMWSLA